MENKIVNLLVKHGFNQITAEEMVAKNFSAAILMFPDARASKLAEIVKCL